MAFCLAFTAVTPAPAYANSLTDTRDYFISFFSNDSNLQNGQQTNTCSEEITAALPTSKYDLSDDSAQDNGNARVDNVITEDNKIAFDEVDGTESNTTDNSASSVDSQNSLDSNKITAEPEDPDLREANVLDVVYLDPGHGNDSNNGDTPDAPVQSFEKAKELLATDGVIVLLSPLEPEGAVTYSLKDKGSAKLTRIAAEDGGTIGSLIRIDSGDVVTLEDITVDGGGESDCADPTIRMDGGSLILNSGATIENRHNAKGSFGTAIEAFGATITMNDGAVIQNNSGQQNQVCWGTVFLANESTFNMLGGTIQNNQTHRGGAVAIVHSTMNMSGGIVNGNKASAPNTMGAYGGAIYVSNFEEASGPVGTTQPISGGDALFKMTGGVIENNSATHYGGAVCTMANSNSSKGVAKVVIEGGTITDNKANTGGGGIAVWDLGNGATSSLSVSGGVISNNSTQSCGGGILVYDAGGSLEAEMTGGEISGNSASYGGGISLGFNGYPTQSAMDISGGMVSGNSASRGGGAWINSSCTLTMMGGTIKGNNAEEDQNKTKGDGVYVGGKFEVKDGASGGPIVDQNNDVYLPSGHVIDVIGPFLSIEAENPINITSEDCAVEPEGGNNPGTKLVNYSTEAGGVEAAQKADENGIYVPSAKMLAQDSTLAIGKSANSNQLNYMTYVKQSEQLWYYEVYYHYFDSDTREWSWVKWKDAQGGWGMPSDTVSISHKQFDGTDLGWDALDGSGPEKLGVHYVFDEDNPDNRLSAKVKEASKDNPLKIYYDATSHFVSYQYDGNVPENAPQLPEKLESQYALVESVAGIPTMPGYTFDGWKTTDVPDDCWLGTVNQGEYYMPNKDVVFKGTWTANTNTPYKVEHYKVDVNGEATLADEENLTGTTGAQVTAIPKTYEGFIYQPAFDENGMKTEAEGTIAGDGTLVLKLYYTAQSTSVSLGAGKLIQGRDLAADEFTFKLSDADGNEVSTATNEENGAVTFDTITYDKPGDYSYTITEVAPEDTDPNADGVQNNGVTYDESVYNVTVQVTDNQEGNLTAKVSYDTEDGTAPLFINTYTAPVEPEQGGENNNDGGLLGMAKTGDFTGGFFAAIAALIAAAAGGAAYALRKMRRPHGRHAR